MSSLKNKNIIIIEGADACGKTQLSNFLQHYVDGKCHVLHSNYSKDIKKSNNYRQHKSIAKYVKKQFNFLNYTGNRLVILDRNYISDIVYGQIGYGSGGTYNKKLKRLNKLLKMLGTKQNGVNLFVIYCRPSKSSNFNFCQHNREELLNCDENEKITVFYDKFFCSNDFKKLCIIHKIKFCVYDFNTDPEYKKLLLEIDNENIYKKEVNK